jgi:hypothetical protein
VPAASADGRTSRQAAILAYATRSCRYRLRRRREPDRRTDVRYGSKVDIWTCVTDVRFTPKSRHSGGRLRALSKAWLCIVADGIHSVLHTCLPPESTLEQLVPIVCLPRGTCALYLGRDRGCVVGARPVCAGRHQGLQPVNTSDVGFGSKADLRTLHRDVRLVPGTNMRLA